MAHIGIQDMGACHDGYSISTREPNLGEILGKFSSHPRACHMATFSNRARKSRFVLGCGASCGEFRSRAFDVSTKHDDCLLVVLEVSGASVHCALEAHNGIRALPENNGVSEPLLECSGL